jgi:SulP family sulfate permease
MDRAAPPSPSSGPSFAELFTPKLVTVFREGYGLADLRADAIAGLTVAIVALPLSMAIAIASGAAPERGLYTAIIGGALISLLGGSRFQVGGPAGAFIVLIAAIVEREGYSGLVLATLIGGAMLVAIGFLQLGTYIKYIPYPVTIGFTTGIAVIIFTSQLRELLGLDMASEPAAMIPKLEAMWAAVATINPAAIGVAGLSLALILGIQRLLPRWPSLLIAVVVAAVATRLLDLDIATLQTRFGGVPSGFPAPAFPEITAAKLQAAVWNGAAIAFLGAIESLLSAVVADGMTGRRHRSNCELVAQGVGNIGSALFGGIAVTGTIARTATNIRAGARGPLAGVFHALYLLLFVLFAAPLVNGVPLAALGAVLAIVAWNMAEKSEFKALLFASRGDAAVLLATFLLTVFVDLTTAIAVGVVLGAFLFLHRMAEAVEIEGRPHMIEEDRADDADGRTRYDPSAATNREVMVYRISGAFFFGATAAVSTVFDRIGTPPKVLILDFHDVPLVDSSGAHALHAFVARMRRAGTTLVIAGTRPSVRRALINAGVTNPDVTFAASVEAARASIA